MSVDIRPAMVALLPRLRAFARALARSSEAADDLVQSTCEKALQAGDSWSPGTRLDSWMYKIMQNQWIDTRRRERPQSPLDDPRTALVASDDGPRIAEARLTLADAAEVIAGMPEDQRAVLVLVCVEGLSYREAGDVLEIPIGTVMSRLSRARRTLIDALELEDNSAERHAGEAR